VIAPELGAAEADRSFEDALERVVVANENPGPHSPATRVEAGRFLRSARRTWAHVGRVGDTHVEVAARPLRTIIDLLILTRNDPRKGVGDAVFDLPVENLGVEGASGVDVIRREVDEDERVWICHGAPLNRCELPN
jgi:hypothetical protein